MNLNNFFRGLIKYDLDTDDSDESNDCYHDYKNDDDDDDDDGKMVIRMTQNTLNIIFITNFNTIFTCFLSRFLLNTTGSFSLDT